MPLIFTQPYFYTTISNPLAGNPVNTKYTNVSLLMHFDGSGVDSSIFNNTSFSKTGGVSFSTTNTKFGTASVYFNGLGDYAQLTNSPQYSFGTDDFTIEAWLYPESLVGTNGGSTIVAGLSTNGDGGGYNRWSFTINSDGSLSFNGGESAGAANTFSVRTEGGVIGVNKWQHVAVSRSNGVMQFFVDGVTKPGVTKSGMPESVAVTSNGPLRLGRLFSGSSWTLLYKGYMDEVRITKGAARYTTDFNVPSEPFADEPTALLLHMDGVSGTNKFVDERNAALIVTAGPTISNAASKFGGTSAYFNGNGGYIATPASTIYGLGTGDFTMELWVNTARVDATYQGLIDTRPSGQASAAKPQLIISADTIGFWVGTTKRLSTTRIQVNTWHHVAVVRKASVTSMFLDGVLTGSIADTTDYGSSNDVVMGVLGDNRTYSPGYFRGYMDEVRIVKGVAMYNGNFTPSASPF